MRNLVFNSVEFPLVPFEDDALNPGIWGRSLANWITDVLKDTPYPVTEDICEDFGYCLMIKKKPYLLWVGCSGGSDIETSVNGLTKELAESFPLDSIEWNVWVVIEGGLFSWFANKAERKQDCTNVEAILYDSLSKVILPGSKLEWR